MAKSPADKKRRQQRIAIGGSVLLVALLAIQVPRTMSMIKGTATPAAASTTVSTTVASAEAAPAATPAAVVPLMSTEPVRKVLPRGGDFRRKDPFAARKSAADGPAVKQRKGDPGFRLVRSSAPTADAPAAVKNGAYVVVLRSLPVRGGRATALRAAADFRRRGIASAGVLLSTKYDSLRRGYYVVHAGRFDNRLAALESLLTARRAGVDNPYIRPLKA